MPNSPEAAENPTPARLSWRFPRTFWFANAAELCERAAFYGMFITLQRYLVRDVGFGDVFVGWIAGFFSAGLYFLPTFTGIMADKIGFRRALLLAFSLLSVGYALLGAFQVRATAVAALTLIMVGGAMVKPVISGTVAKCSDSAHRARAMSIFYMIVNIGSFSGKGLAAEMNLRLGLQYINFYAAGMAIVAWVVVALFYRNVDTKGAGKTVREALQGLAKVLRNFRFLSLIMIVGGFWVLQTQVNASMCTYIERMLGEGYRPEWLANINPLVVVLLVVPITHLVRTVRPASSIGIGLFLIPFTALLIGAAPAIESYVGPSIDLGGLRVPPLILMIILGVGLQGLAECFLSPKFLEYASKQAPEGEVGLYLGYQYLTSFFGWLSGFVVAGYLLDGFCPDPATLSEAARAQRQAALAGAGPMPDAYAHAHYIWFAFAGIGAAAFLALLVFRYTTDRLDRQRANEAHRSQA